MTFSIDLLSTLFDKHNLSVKKGKNHFVLQAKLEIDRIGKSYFLQ